MFLSSASGRQDGNAWKWGFLVIIEWSRGPPSAFGGRLQDTFYAAVTNVWRRALESYHLWAPCLKMVASCCFKYLHFVLKRDPLVIFYTLKYIGYEDFCPYDLERNLEKQIISRLWSQLTWSYNRGIDVKVGQPFGTKPWIVQAPFWSSVVCWDGRGCRRYPWSSIILNHIQIASITYEIIWAICCITL